MSKFLNPENVYDVDSIRCDFPALSREIYGNPLVYLDNSASAQKPKQVIDAVTDTYRREYANVHRGLHFLSNAVTDIYEKSRETTRKFLNAGSSEQIVFTKSATEAINLVAYGYAMPNLTQGDEIILTQMEHHSNIVPWNFLRERQGIKLRWVPVCDDGGFDLQAFSDCLNDRTKMVAITHMSNVLGTIVPIKDVVKIAHERGIPVLVDGSQAVVHLSVDVDDLDVDFYVFTGHKVYGPSGVGVLYGKSEILDSTRPFQGGGEMIVDVTEESVTYAKPPHRFEAGTPPIVQVIGLGSALEYFMSKGRESIFAHEDALLKYAIKKMNNIKSLRIFGTAFPKGAIISFELPGIHSHDISMIIDRSGVAIRAGTHCAQPLLKRFGVTSTCRASFAMYNTFSEVDKFVEALEYARDFFYE